MTLAKLPFHKVLKPSSFMTLEIQSPIDLYLILMVGLAS